MEAPTPAQQQSLKEAELKDLKAKNYLFQSIDKTTLKTITQKETAKQLWDSMKVKHQGNARVKRAQLQRLRKSFKTLEMKIGEKVSDYFARVMEVTNDMRNCGEILEDVKIVEKILGALLKTSTLWYAQLRNPKTLIVSRWMNFKSLQIHESKVTEQFFKWKMSQGMLEEEEEGILREEEAVIVDEEGANHL